ncbi:hypothetical protein IW262DRAFT_1445679 [Armillaria fumosa]|nr:hypothetical protein IW262DRAFT_1445679 [Armillaria fumosa]
MTFGHLGNSSAFYRNRNPFKSYVHRCSEQMSLVQFFMPTEVTHDTVAELGELGGMFNSKTVNPTQCSFIGEIRRIDEMARRVRFFSSQLAAEKDVVLIRPLYDSAPLITIGRRAAQTLDEMDVPLPNTTHRRKSLLRLAMIARDRSAQVQQSGIRTSFDEGSAPLLQHDDRENQFSISSSIPFDLE